VPAALALSTVPEPERPADGFARSAVGGAAQIFLETITPDAIPPASVSSQARTDVIRMRAPAIRSVYRNGLAFLAIARNSPFFMLFPPFAGKAKSQ
jgi:hypothetical protein